jgi:hypothetical protein
MSLSICSRIALREALQWELTLMRYYRMHGIAAFEIINDLGGMAGKW